MSQPIRVPAKPVEEEHGQAWPPASFVERLRGLIRRVLPREPVPPPEEYESPQPAYLYTVYWVKTTQEWDQARRERIAREVVAVIERADFEPNPAIRRYQVEGLEGRYSGLSLLALRKVLEVRIE